MSQNDPSRPVTLDARSQARADVSRARRELGEKSLSSFLKIYLSQHCTAKPSQMHLELFALLEEATMKRGQRIAVAAPRGHAKTTLVNTAYLLWSICYKKEPYILLVSDTSDQACDHLSHVKKELESNQRLIEDFPEACEVPGVPPKSPRWRKNEIITRNDVKVTACGEGTGIRGRKFKQHRPTLILIDDLEDKERVFSEEQRNKTRDWFNSSLLKMGSSITNVVIVGTILHYDSLLCGLTNPQLSPVWKGRIYRAIMEWPERSDLWAEWENVFRNRSTFGEASGPEAAEAYFHQNRDDMERGAKVLWPERESLHDLMVCRESEGRSTFDSEKQNEPVNPTECFFPESDMHFWDEDGQTEDELLTRLGKRAFFIGACDPSLGRAGAPNRGPWSGKGDYSAIIMLLWHVEAGVLYVMDADIRHRKPDAIIDDVLTLYRHRNCQALGFETNGFQNVLAGQLQERARARRMFPSIFGINNYSDKKGRLTRLQPMISSGAIRFSRRHRLLLEQLRQFPLGSRDDGPDALEMAVHLAEHYGNHQLEVASQQQMRDLERTFRMAASDDYMMWQAMNGHGGYY